MEGMARHKDQIQDHIHYRRKDQIIQGMDTVPHCPHDVHADIVHDDGGDTGGDTGSDGDPVEYY